MSRYAKNVAKVNRLVAEISKTHPLILKELDNYDNYRRPLIFRYQHNTLPPINITFTINDQSVDEFSTNIYVEDSGIECWAIQKFGEWNFKVWKNNQPVKVKQSSNMTDTIINILNWMADCFR